MKERVLYFVCLSCFVGHIADSSASALFHHKRKLLVPHVSNEGNILIRRFPSLMKLFSWWVYAFNQDSLKRI